MHSIDLWTPDKVYACGAYEPPTLDGSSELQCFERGNKVEIHNGIIFDLYPGLPHK